MYWGLEAEVYTAVVRSTLGNSSQPARRANQAPAAIPTPARTVGSWDPILAHAGLSLPICTLKGDRGRQKEPLR